MQSGNGWSFASAFKVITNAAGIERGTIDVAIGKLKKSVTLLRRTIDAIKQDSEFYRQMNSEKRCRGGMKGAGLGRSTFSKRAPEAQGSDGGLGLRERGEAWKKKALEKRMSKSDELEEKKKIRANLEEINKQLGVKTPMPPADILSLSQWKSTLKQKQANLARKLTAESPAQPQAQTVEMTMMEYAKKRLKDTEEEYRKLKVDMQQKTLILYGEKPTSKAWKPFFEIFSELAKNINVAERELKLEQKKAKEKKKKIDRASSVQSTLELLEGEGVKIEDGRSRSNEISS